MKDKNGWKRGLDTNYGEVTGRACGFGNSCVWREDRHRGGGCKKLPHSSAHASAHALRPTTGHLAIQILSPSRSGAERTSEKRHPPLLIANAESKQGYTHDACRSPAAVFTECAQFRARLSARPRKRVVGPPSQKAESRVVHLLARPGGSAPPDPPGVVRL